MVGGVDAHLGHVGGGQDPKGGVVVGGRDGVELVVVAAGTGHRQALRGLEQHVDLVVDLIGPGLDGIRRGIEHLPKPVHAGGNWIDKVCPVAGQARGQQVAGDLLLQEQVVRQVRVEGFDDVVAIAPRVQLVVVELVPVRLRPANQIQPVPAPTLAVARGLQKSGDHTVERSGSIVGHEPLDLLGRWRKARQAECHSPQQRASVGVLWRRQAFGLKPREDEPIRACAYPVAIADLRGRRPAHRPEAPERPSGVKVDRLRRRLGLASSRVRRAHADPFFDARDLLGWQPARRRHSEVGRSVRDGPHQEARGGIPGLDSRPAAPASQQPILAVELQAAHRQLLGAVTGIAVVRQHGADKLLKVLNPTRLFGSRE